MMQDSSGDVGYKMSLITSWTFLWASEHISILPHLLGPSRASFATTKLESRYKSKNRKDAFEPQDTHAKSLRRGTSPPPRYMTSEFLTISFEVSALRYDLAILTKKPSKILQYFPKEILRFRWLELRTMSDSLAFLRKNAGQETSA